MVTANRIPSERANSHQTIKMAEAMEAQGWQVKLLTPRRHDTPAVRALTKPEAIWHYYHVQTPFTIRHLPCWDSRRLFRRQKKWWFSFISFTFALSLSFYLISRRRSGPFVVYTREDRFAGHMLAWLKPLLRVPMIFESHRFPPTERNLAWQRRMDGIVTISRGLQKAYLEAGFPSNRLLVAPDAVDLELFCDLPRRETARQELGLPLNRPLIIYTGHLYRWKGVHTLAKAAQDLPQALVVFVGGTEKDVEAFRSFVRDIGLTNVRVTGHVPPAQVPLYLAAADVLALPNSAEEDISRLYTSPLKLFEYMAAGRPIVASDIPSLREVLTDGVNAHLVTPDDPEALARGIRELLNDTERAGRLAHQARQEAVAYTWARRAEKVTAFIQSLAGAGT